MVRPYKGTLMYYRSQGIYDPYEAEEAPEPYPGQRTSDIIYYLEQSHHEHQSARHKPSHTLQGQRVQAQAHDTFRPQAPRRGGKRHQTRPEQSRELVGPPRPGRATELFLQGRARADHHVVDETNVCPTVPRSRSLYRGPKISLKKSPWNAASDSALGDPRDAFQENRPPELEVERLHRQPPARSRIHAPATKPRPGYSEMDYARPPQQYGGQQFRQPAHRQQPPLQQSSSWSKGSAPGDPYKRFHSNVVPYETDFNRKAKGWSSSYVHEDPTDYIFPHDDLDSYKSPSVGSGGSGGNRPPARDYNPRPTAWQGGEEEEEEPFVPLSQRRSNFEQSDQQAYYQQQQQQQYHQQQPQRAHHHQQPQRAQHHQRPPQQQQRRPPQPRAKPQGRGSAAYQPHYAGPQHQQQSWGGGGLMESDDL